MQYGPINEIVDQTSIEQLRRKSYDWGYTQGSDGKYGWRILSSSDSLRGTYDFVENDRSRTYWGDTDWKAARERDGYLPTRPYGDSQTWITRSTGRMWFPHSSGLGNASELYGNVHWGVTPSSYIDSLLRQRFVDDAKLSALLKAKDAKANLPVFLAEAKKASDMVAETAQKLFSAYRDVRRGRFSKASKRLGIKGPKGPSNNWLSYKYGWLPLLSDVKGFSELAAQEMLGRPLRFSVKSPRIGTEVPFNVLSQSGVTGEFHGSNRNQGITTYQCRAGLLLEIHREQDAFASQIGISDPALVAWELVPFSFVFDWFISVGRFLQVQTALNGMTVRVGFTSSLVTVSGESTYVETNKSYFNDFRPVAFVHRSYSRSAWDGSFPLVSLAYVNRDPLNITKLITLLALTRQRIPGPGRSLAGIG